MGTQREEAVISLGVDHSKVEPGLKAAGHKISEWAGEVAAHLTAAFTVGGAIAGFERLLSFAKDIKRISEGTGLSTGLTQDLINLGKASGVAQDKIEGMLDAFAKNLAPGSDPETALFQLADKLKGIEDPGERARLAVENFGRSGIKLLPILDQGAAGLRNMADQFGRISDVQIEMLEHADRILEKTGNKMKVKGAEMIEGLSIFGRAFWIALHSGTVKGLDALHQAQDESEEAFWNDFNAKTKARVAENNAIREDAEHTKKLKEAAEKQDFLANMELRKAAKVIRDNEMLAKEKENLFEKHLKKLQDIWFNNPVPSQPRDPGSPNRPGPHGDPGNAPGPGGDAGNPIQNHIGDIDAITQEQGIANMNVKAGNLEWARMRQGRINAAKDRLVNNLQKEMNDQNNKSPRDMLIDEIMKRLKGGMDKKGAIPVAVMDDDE